MAQYKVENALLDGYKVGDIVSDSDFHEGIHIDALIQGGFLSLSGKTKISTVDESTEENTKG